MTRVEGAHWAARLKSLIAFFGVGAAAALTHLLVFRMALTGFIPEVANALGFLIAFWVSFFGHRMASFRDTQNGVGESLLKFGFTAVAGFLVNELVFVVLHRVFSSSVWLAVFVGMGVAAAQTYGLSRYWAFKR